jgi:hypothetical protein
VHATDHRHFFDDREHFILADVHGDLVRVTVGHKARGGAVTGHPKTTRIVDDDEIGPAALNELRADSRSRAAAMIGSPRSRAAAGDHAPPAAYRGFLFQSRGWA